MENRKRRFETQTITIGNGVTAGSYDSPVFTLDPYYRWILGMNVFAYSLANAEYFDLGLKDPNGTIIDLVSYKQFDRPLETQFNSIGPIENTNQKFSIITRVPLTLNGPLVYGVVFVLERDKD